MTEDLSLRGKAGVVPYLDGDSSVIARKLAIFRFIWGGGEILARNQDLIKL